MNLPGILAAGMMLAAGASVLAQSKPAPREERYVPTGSRIAVKPTDIKGAELYRTFDRMAQCIVRAAPDRADFFMRQSDDYGLGEPVSEVTKFLPLPKCVGAVASPDSVSSTARFNPRSLRNWLSEELYLDAHATFEPFDPEVPLVERTFFSRQGLMRAQGLGKFSDCLVATDARSADALVRTKRASDEEDAAARAMVPALAECLPADQTITLDPDTIRGLAAQGLWQRYEAAKPTRFAGKAKS